MEENKIIESVKDKLEDVAKDISKDIKKKNSVFDSLLEKIVSRKLLVWIVATGFLVYAKIDGDQWIALSLAYIGLQGAADIATKYMSARK